LLLLLQQLLLQHPPELQSFALQHPLSQHCWWLNCEFRQQLLFHQLASLQLAQLEQQDEKNGQQPQQPPQPPQPPPQPPQRRCSLGPLAPWIGSGAATGLATGAGSGTGLARVEAAARAMAASTRTFLSIVGLVGVVCVCVLGRDQGSLACWIALEVRGFARGCVA